MKPKKPHEPFQLELQYHVWVHGVVVHMFALQIKGFQYSLH